MKFSGTHGWSSLPAVFLRCGIDTASFFSAQTVQSSRHVVDGPPSQESTRDPLTGIPGSQETTGPAHTRIYRRTWQQPYPHR